MAEFTQAQAMIELFNSYIPTRVIYVAAKLDLADHIGDHGAVAQELAAKLNVHPDALYRFMRVLAGLGVLRQEGDDRFFVTAFGDTLRKNSSQSVRDYAIYSHESTYERVGKLLDSIRSGEPAVDDYFAKLGSDPERQAIFLAGSGNKSRVETAAIIAGYDFSRCGRVVDVGGGNGSFLSAVLTACEQVSGVLFDQSAAIEAAKSGRGGPMPRCEFVAGNFFDAVPPGGDTYILKRILDDWPDDKVLQILQNCRKVMPSGCRLLIIEPLMGPSNKLCPGHLADMNFLVTFKGGRIRTEEEHAKLLQQAGFRLRNSYSTESEVSMLEAFAV
jgi:O-methyltransferase/methyltransferase family protein